jgi:hypothetical protein
MNLRRSYITECRIVEIVNRQSSIVNRMTE